MQLSKTTLLDQEQWIGYSIVKSGVGGPLVEVIALDRGQRFVIRRPLPPGHPVSGTLVRMNAVYPKRQFQLSITTRKIGTHREPIDACFVGHLATVPGSKKLAVTFITRTKIEPARPSGADERRILWAAVAFGEGWPKDLAGFSTRCRERLVLFREAATNKLSGQAELVGVLGVPVDQAATATRIPKGPATRSADARKDAIVFMDVSLGYSFIHHDGTAGVEVFRPKGALSRLKLPLLHGIVHTLKGLHKKYPERRFQLQVSTPSLGTGTQASEAFLVGHLSLQTRANGQRMVVRLVAPHRLNSFDPNRPAALLEPIQCEVSRTGPTWPKAERVSSSQELLVIFVEDAAQPGKAVLMDIYRGPN